MVLSGSIKQLVNVTVGIQNAISNWLYGIALLGEKCVSVKSVFLVPDYRVLR